MKKNTEVSADINNWPEVYQIFKNYFLEMDIEKNISTQLLVVIEEIFTNIAYYSGLDTKQKISIECEITGKAINIAFVDSGKPFDITKMEAKNYQTVGGFGINIVKKIMDDISYDNVNGRNKITLIKNLK